MQSPARLEIRLRLVRSQGARPNSEFPGTERLESQLEQAASRRLCKQPRLYKHCAASARKRSSSKSRFCHNSPTRAGNGSLWHPDFGLQFGPRLAETVITLVHHRRPDENHYWSAFVSGEKRLENVP